MAFLWISNLFNGPLVLSTYGKTRTTEKMKWHMAAKPKDYVCKCWFLEQEQEEAQKKIGVEAVGKDT